MEIQTGIYLGKNPIQTVSLELVEDVERKQGIRLLEFWRVDYGITEPLGKLLISINSIL